MQKLLVLVAVSIALLVCANPVIGFVEDEISVKEQIQILRSGDKQKRKAAVNRLVKVGTKEAWLGVIEALGNENAPAADEAQFDLAGMDNDKLFVSLLGKAGLGSKSRVVQLRVAELIGRREMGVEAKRLKKAMKARDDEVRRLVVWSVERLAVGGWILGDSKADLGKELIKLSKRDGDGAVRGAALFAYLAIHGDEATSAVAAKVAQDKLAAARCAAALNMRLLPPALAAKLLGDREGSVRRAAVSGAAAAVRSMEGDRRMLLGALVERMGVEERPRIGWSIVDVLRELSGKKYRRDSRPWRDWVAGLSADWAPDAEAAKSAKGGDVGEVTAAFAGLPLLSDRLAFLIDFSGSIWNAKNGKLPKDLVGVELNKALDRLPAETLFNVMPYTNTPFPWLDEMVLAKPKQIKAAKEFYADCRERGAGNVYDAINLALKDPRCDTLVILTDGAPSGGTRWKLELMVPALLEANRYRAISFDSLLVGAPRGLVRHWETLARESGGRCVSIELK